MRNMRIICIVIGTAGTIAGAHAQEQSEPKPWKAGLTLFTLPDKAGASVGTGWGISVGYTFTPKERRDRHEDIVSFDYRAISAAGVNNTIIGLFYDRLVKSRQFYFGGGLGYVRAEASSVGLSRDDLAWRLIGGYYVDPKHTTALELTYVNGGAPINTHIGLALVVRF